MTFSPVNQFTQAMTVTRIGPWAGNQGSAFTALIDYFTPTPKGDDFNGTSLNTSLWTKQDAVGDATLSVSGGELQIIVPGGASHDPYTSGNNGVEVLQSVVDGDIQAVAKFDSTPGEEGLMALQDTSTYVRCDVDGSSSGVNAYSAYLSGSSVTNAVFMPLPNAASYWLRLSRQGSTWTCSASTDGVTFYQVNQFMQSMTLNQIGPWAGNTGTAFTGLVDYFH